MITQDMLNVGCVHYTQFKRDYDGKNDIHNISICLYFNNNDSLRIKYAIITHLFEKAPPALGTRYLNLSKPLHSYRNILN